jgi:hypothetical protein
MIICFTNFFLKYNLEAPCSHYSNLSSRPQNSYRLLYVSDSLHHKHLHKLSCNQVHSRNVASLKAYNNLAPCTIIPCHSWSVLVRNLGHLLKQVTEYWSITKQSKTRRLTELFIKHPAKTWVDLQRYRYFFQSAETDNDILSVILWISKRRSSIIPCNTMHIIRFIGIIWNNSF